MFDLPIKAFSFDGIDGSIEIYIEEVFGYPDETSIDGGYDLKGFINLKANCYSVTNGELWFSSGGLYRFKNQLEPCYKSLQGNAHLRTFEHEFSLKADFKKNGHVIISGSYKQRPDVENELLYEIISDQTQLVQTLIDLKNIEKILGDDTGIRK